MSGSVFEVTARSYRLGRTPYPEAMLAWVEERSGDLRGELVADLGCGPGLLSLPLVRRGARVVAIDLAARMLGELRRGAATAGAPHLVRARAEDLPLRSASVHLAACSQSLHWMEWPRVLAEARRVLRPDGFLLLCWQGWMEPGAEVEQIYRRALAEEAPELLGRPRTRPRMEAVEGLLAAAPGERFEGVQEVRFDLRRLVRFYLSRSSMGALDDLRRRRLRRRWLRLASEHLGAQISYRFRVGAALRGASWAR